MAEQLLKNVRMITDLLREHGPDCVDRPFVQEMLDGQYKELASLQAVRPVRPVTDTRISAVPSTCSRPTHNYSFD